jgi:hypothetical protein
VARTIVSVYMLFLWTKHKELLVESINKVIDGVGPQNLQRTQYLASTMILFSAHDAKSPTFKQEEAIHSLN